MESSRDFSVRSKPRIVLDKSFPISRLLNIGDKGQCYLYGSISAERMETQRDGTDLFIKTIQIDKVEIIENKEARTTTAGQSGI